MDVSFRSRDDSELPLASSQPGIQAVAPLHAVDDIALGGHRPQSGMSRSPWQPLVVARTFPGDDDQAVSPITGARRVRPAIQRLVGRLKPRETAADVILLGVGDMNFNPLGKFFGQAPQPIPGMRSAQSFETVLDIPQGVRTNLMLVDIGPDILAAAEQDARIAARLRPDEAVEVTGVARDLRCLPWPPRSADVVIATWTILYAMNAYDKEHWGAIAARKKGQLTSSIINALRPGAPGLLVDFTSFCHMVRGIYALSHWRPLLGQRRTATLLKQGHGMDDFSTGLAAARELLNGAGQGLFDIEIAQEPERRSPTTKGYPALCRIWRTA